MREICQDQYRVAYNPATATVVCAGTFRLHDREYEPIQALLNSTADAAGSNSLILDLREARFLNSAGINALAQFVIRLRQRACQQLVIKGNTQHHWQRKSLKNFARLLSVVQLEMD